MGEVTSKNRKREEEEKERRRREREEKKKREMRMVMRAGEKMRSVNERGRKNKEGQVRA